MYVYLYECMSADAECLSAYIECMSVSTGCMSADAQHLSVYIECKSVYWMYYECLYLVFYSVFVQCIMSAVDIQCIMSVYIECAECKCKEPSDFLNS